MSGADDASVETTGTGSDCAESINDTDVSFREDNSNGSSDPVGFEVVLFPRDDMLAISHNLNPTQLHAPPFQLQHLNRCLRDSYFILRKQDRTPPSEVEYVRKFIRDVVISAFEKYFREDLLRRSTDSIHASLLMALTYLAALVAEVLRHRLLVLEAADAPEASELEQDLQCLLSALAYGLDANSVLYKLHRTSTLPTLVYEDTAEFLSIAGLPDIDDYRVVDPNLSSWLMHVVEQLTLCTGYQLVFKALREPMRFSLSLLDNLMLLLRQTCQYLREELNADAAQAVRDLLSALDHLVQHDPEKLAEQGRDRTYWHFSRMLDFAYITLSTLLTRPEADAAVSAVQRHFVEVMLKSSNFNKLLSAMRECSRLLQRSRDIQKDDARASLQTNIAWLEEQKVVKQMLRANLHQTQYVEQVVSVLTALSEEGFLLEEHLDMLWNLTEQEETFDAVKFNVYGILAEIASSMGPSQLDMLFRKFQVNKSRSVADTQRLLDLLKRLASCDSQDGAMADKLLQMVWDMTMPCDMPRELLLSNAIPEILREYDPKGNSGHIRHYIQRCIQQLQTHQDCTTAVHLLRDLFELLPSDQGRIDPEQPNSREATFEWLDEELEGLALLVGNLKAHMQQGRDALSDSPRGTLPGEGIYSYQDVVEEYMATLRGLGQCSSGDFPVEIAMELWDTIFTLANTEKDVEGGCMWFAMGAETSGCLGIEACEQLFQERLTKLPPTSVTQPVFSCILKYFIEVNTGNSKLVRPAEKAYKGQRLPCPYYAVDLDMAGLDYMWQVMLMVPHTEVAGYAQKVLINVYQGAVASVDNTTHVVHAAFIRDATRHLMESARLLAAKATEPGPPNGPRSVAGTTAAMVERCLTILHEFVDASQGRTMPPAPAHKASHRGVDMLLEVQLMSNTPRVRLAVHSNEYIGSVRCHAGIIMGCPPGHVRLLYGGKEWDNDSMLVGMYVVKRGGVLHCTQSPHPNSFSKFTPEYTQDWQMHSPLSLLSRTESIYDVLFSLADYPHAPAVRQRALDLLQMMPTCPPIPVALRQALASDQPPQRLEALLSSGTADAPAPPSKLLYVLQAMHGVLFPVRDEDPPAPASQPAELRNAFLASGCPSLLFRTVHNACVANAKDVTYLRSIHSHMVLMFSALVNYTQQQGQEKIQEAALSDSEGGTAKVPGKADQRMADAETDETSAGAAVALPARAAAMTVDSSPASNGSPVRGDDATGRLDSETLRLTMAYLVQLALDAAFGWRILSMETLSKETEAGPEVRLVRDALGLLHHVVESHPELYTDLLAMPCTRRMAGDLLLNRWLRPVRHAMLELLERTCIGGGASAAAHYWLLELLAERRADADRLGVGAVEYYELFAKVVGSLRSSAPEAVPLATRLLQELVEGINALARSGAPRQAKDEGSETVLEGQLKLVRSLVETLERHTVGSPGEGDLVHLLLAEFLFPEALLWAERGSDGQVVSPERLPAALECRCTTPLCRRAALDLVADLMINNPANLEAGAALLHRLHLDHTTADDHWEQQPPSNMRSPDGYVGLKNAGATCYMNAVCQQLFMQPKIRQLVLSAVEVDVMERQDSVFHQLQVMFAWLMLSKNGFFVPRHFWHAFKDYDGQPIDVREHQDAYEFFTRLQDFVDQHLSASNQRPAMKAVMGGRFVQHIICRDIDYRSEREEEFYQISVDVRGKRSLEESLHSYVQGELMEGDNAYFCEDIGRRVTAVKRSCIKELPHTLSFHLKRFEFDHHQQSRFKVRDRFEFPLALDMYRYTADGLEELERQAAAAQAGAAGVATPAPRPHPASYYSYELRGVVVHSGTAFAGHYYSYIKERPTPGPDGRTPEGRWFCFDDKAVRPWDVAMLEQDCFGGTINQDYAAQGKLQRQDLDRPHSAYMLFYERRDELPSPPGPLSVSVPDSQQPGRQASSQEAPGPAAQLGSEAMDDSFAVEVPSAQSPQGMPRGIWETVMRENLQMVYRLHLLDKDYFRFVRMVVESSACISSKKVRRTGDTLGPTTSGSMSCDAGGSGAGSGEASDNSASRRSNDAAHVVRVCLRLAVHFVLKVYLPAHSTLRADNQQWRDAVVNAIEPSATAARVVIEELLQLRPWLQATFLSYQQQQPRWLFTVLISTALRRALQPPAPSSSPPPASPMDTAAASPLPSPSSRASDDALAAASQLVLVLVDLLHKASMDSQAEMRGLLQVLLEASSYYPGLNRLLVDNWAINHLTHIIGRLSPHDVTDDLWTEELAAAYALLGQLYIWAVETLTLQHQQHHHPGPNAPAWQTPEYILNVHKLLTHQNVLYTLVPAMAASNEAMALGLWLTTVDSPRDIVTIRMLEVGLDLMATAGDDAYGPVADVVLRLVDNRATPQTLTTRGSLLLFGTRQGPQGLLEAVMGRMQSVKRIRMLQLITWCLDRSPLLVDQLISAMDSANTRFNVTTITQWLQSELVAMEKSLAPRTPDTVAMHAIMEQLIERLDELQPPPPR